MQVLKKEHIMQVDSKIRNIVYDAVCKNESVPFGVTLISCRQPTLEELKRGRKLERFAEKVLGRTK